MEQKTEASQAVDERAEMIEALRMCVVALEHTGIGSRTRSIAQNNAADVLARAALKAQPAPTEAAQGSFLVRVTPVNPEYADVHPQLALEDALRVRPHGWPDGFQFEVVAAQPDRHALQAEGKHPAPCARHCEATAFGIEIRRLTAENAQLRAAQGEDSARLDDLATIRDLDKIGMEFAARLARMDTTTIKGRDYLYREDVMISVTDWRSAWSKNSQARKPIDRARASAETGGVKP